MRLFLPDPSEDDEPVGDHVSQQASMESCAERQGLTTWDVERLAWEERHRFEGWNERSLLEEEARYEARRND